MSQHKSSRFLILLAASLDDWHVQEQNGYTDLVHDGGVKCTIPGGSGLSNSTLMSFTRRLCRYTTQQDRPDIDGLAAHAKWRIPNDVRTVINMRWTDDVIDDDDPLGIVQFESEAQPEPAQEDPVPETTQPAKPKRQRGVAETVMSYLIDAGSARTTQQIVTATGFTRQQVHTACHGLRSKGAVRAIKTGVFVADDVRSHSRVDVQHHADGITFGTAHATHTPTPPTITVTAPTPPEAALNSALDVDIMNDVLDLMFPAGFKARHLPAIEAWKTATLRLIREVAP